jgi:hypothetical protein
MNQNQNLQAIAELIDKTTNDFRISLEAAVKKFAAVQENSDGETSDTTPAEESKETLPTEFGAAVERIEQKIDKVDAQVQDFAYKDKINSELHDELQKYRTGLRKELITPLLKHIIREYDRVGKQYKFYRQREQEAQAPQGELFGKLLKEFDVIGAALLELLNDYGIETFEAKEGEPYLAKTQKIIDTIATDDDTKNATVASCETSGFRDIENDRLLLQAEVKIYKKN